MRREQLFYGFYMDSQILEAVAQAMDRVHEHYALSDRPNAGCFTLRSAQSGDLFLLRMFGNLPLEKQKDYFRRSIEKGERLGNDLLQASSWASRKPDEDKWGGAIRVNLAILSFSGFYEDSDEAVVVYAARLLGWISVTEARQIAELSKNEKLLTLLEA